MSASADWISLTELRQLTGWSPRTVRRKKAAGELVTRDGEPGRNGKPQIEYDASALGARFQDKLLRHKLAAGALHKPSSRDTGPRSTQTILTLDSLKGEALAQATERLGILGPMIAFANDKQKPLTEQRIVNLSDVAKYVASRNGQSERTIWNWWKSYKSGGPGALADRPRRDKNVSRFFEEHPAAKEFILNKFLNEHLSISVTHDALEREWERLRLDEGDRVPCYQTTRSYLKSIPPIIPAVLREGEKTYNSDFAAFIVRDIGKVAVNEYWISDHMIHDVWVRNVDDEGHQVFGEHPLHFAFRPWLTCIVDMRSRLVVGAIWCATPSSNSISSALRCAMREFGKPNVFYIDNGKDYKKLGKSLPGLSPDAQGVLVRLGIRSQHCLPKHPQSKQIESFFRTVHKRLDQLWISYCGESPARRPDRCDELLRLHKQLVASGKGNDSPLPTAREFIDAACAWLHIDFNTNWNHSGRGMRGMTPQQIFDSELPPPKRKAVNLPDVAQLFWERQPRMVIEGGCLQLNNARYQPADAESAAALQLHIKRQVLVAFDPYNVGEAIALSHDGVFLGHLRAQELMVHGKTSADEIRASMRVRRNVFKAIKQAGERLERARIAAGDLSEVQVLQKRAAASGMRPVLHTLPAAVAVNMEPKPRKYIDDIVEEFFED